MIRMRMRAMEPRDIPGVLELCREQNDRDGTAYPVPQVFDANGNRSINVPLALVAVDQKDRVMQAHIFQRTIEMTSFGSHPGALSVSLAEIDLVCMALRDKGYTDMHVQVPMKRRRWFRKFSRQGSVIAGALRRIGFTRDDQRLAHFYRELGENS